MTTITIGSILLFIYLTCMVALAQFKGDTSIANFTWGGGVMLVALYTFFSVSTFLIRQILITVAICIWASRLIIYVYKRYTGKDPRFISWKWQGLKALVINMFWIYGQIIMITIMSYPIYLINTYNVPGLTILDILGFLIFIFGFSFESLADKQLSSFLKNPENKGKVMRYSLWKYSRHPNYFGESIIWWGIYIVALSVPYGWTAIIAPITITFLLRFVTGVPLIEKTMENNPEYQEYKKKTSTFVPWFSKE